MPCRSPAETTAGFAVSHQSLPVERLSPHNVASIDHHSPASNDKQKKKKDSVTNAQSYPLGTTNFQLEVGICDLTWPWLSIPPGAMGRPRRLARRHNRRRCVARGVFLKKQANRRCLPTRCTCPDATQVGGCKVEKGQMLNIKCCYVQKEWHFMTMHLKLRALAMVRASAMVIDNMFSITCTPQL
jgi:hypothetical protein